LGTVPNAINLTVMENTWHFLFVVSIGSIAGLIGGLILLFRKNWALKLASVSVPLAAGVLLSISFLDLLPEAVEEYGRNAFVVIFAVFVILFLVERFFFFFHHHQEETEKHISHSHSSSSTVAPLIILGDTIHNFLDGLVIGSSYSVNPSLASLVAFSTFLHETPHEIADFGILLNKGWSRRRTFLANLFSSLATFPGAFVAYYYSSRFENSEGFLLALAAGFFLYVSTTDFLPEATHAPKKFIGRQALFLLLGIAAVASIRLIFPELGH